MTHQEYEESSDTEEYFYNDHQWPLASQDAYSWGLYYISRIYNPNYPENIDDYNHIDGGGNNGTHWNSHNDSSAQIEPEEDEYTVSFPENPWETAEWSAGADTENENNNSAEPWREILDSAVLQEWEVQDNASSYNQADVGNSWNNSIYWRAAQSCQQNEQIESAPAVESPWQANLNGLKKRRVWSEHGWTGVWEESGDQGEMDGEDGGDCSSYTG